MIGLLSTLTLVLQIALVVLLAEVVVARMRRRPSRLAAILGKDALRLAALVAIVATAGSLYFSEVRGFVPCEYCWYQRIAMYPLGLVLAIAAWRNDRAVQRYAIPLAGLGAVVSAYHVQLERFPDQAHDACNTAVPCTLVWFQEFGYVTLPVMALTAFAAIITLLVIAARARP